jgi:DNA-binding response OmpR family regulator
MSHSPTGNISASDTVPGGRAAADLARTVQARPTVALVVDDEPKIRDLARRYLEADGFQVLEAADGEAALTVLAETEPDIVVTDIMMPVLNGLELLRQIRLTSSVPIVMLTARDDEIDKVLALTTGADDYVTKPFGGRELAARLRAILRRLQPPHAAWAADNGEAAEPRSPSSASRSTPVAAACTPAAEGSP